MNFAKMFLCLLFVSLGHIGSAEQCGSSIPASVRQVIIQFHDWKIVDESDLPIDDQKLWSTSHAGLCPGFVTGKFSNAENLSYVIALIHKGPTTGILEQLIVLEPVGTSFRQMIAVKPTKVISPFVVWRVPPGNYQGVEDEKPMQISNDSFVYEKMEAYATQFYYDHDLRLRSFVVSD